MIIAGLIQGVCVCVCVCWHSRLKTSDRCRFRIQSVEFMRTSQLGAWPVLFHGNVITWAEPSLRGPYTRVYGLTCCDAYPTFRGVHRVSRKRGRILIGEALLYRHRDESNLLSISWVKRYFFIYNSKIIAVLNDYYLYNEYPEKSFLHVLFSHCEIFQNLLWLFWRLKKLLLMDRCIKRTLESLIETPRRFCALVNVYARR